MSDFNFVPPTPKALFSSEALRILRYAQNDNEREILRYAQNDNERDSSLRALRRVILERNEMQRRISSGKLCAEDSKRFFAMLRMTMREILRSALADVSSSSEMKCSEGSRRESYVRKIARDSSLCSE